MNTTQSSETSLPRPSRLWLRLVFWAAVVLLFLGLASSSPPGADEWFYSFTGCLLLAGLFVPGWRYRTASVVLIVYSISCVVSGYQRSIEFQCFLEQHGQPHLTP